MEAMGRISHFMLMEWERIEDLERKLHDQTPV